MGKVDTVELRMRKLLCAGVKTDEKVYLCELLRYDKKHEALYLTVTSEELTSISLDAVYDCEMKSGEEILQCTGRVKERYCQKDGKTIKFEIENGFYKINIKTVDKQMA